MPCPLKIFEADATDNPLRLSRVALSYELYRRSAMDGDLLLWEPRPQPRDEIGHIIAAATRGSFCHASGVVHVHGRPFQSAYREGQNGFLSPLSAEVRRNSGLISVFRVAMTDEQRERVAAHLIEDLGGDYAWANIALIAGHWGWVGRLAASIPFVRAGLERGDELQSRKQSGAICSQHYARALQAGANVELSPGRQLALISPNDLGRSARVKYLGTLIWPENWKQ